MEICKNWVENDLNPIISFSSDAKIIYSNNQAQYLLNRVKKNELFDLTIKYAPKNFGEQTTYIDLKLATYRFYAITIMYENEDEIHLKLYKSVTAKKHISFDNTSSYLTNIFTLIDLALLTNSLKTGINFIKNYDPSIPDFKLNQNSFLKEFSNLLELFSNSKNVTCQIKLKTGEYIRLDSKKYSLISIKISSNELKNKISLDTNSSFIIDFGDDFVNIDLPLILE